MPRIVNNRDGPRKVELDVTKSTATNEYDALSSSMPASKINELGVVNAFKSSPPPPDQQMRLYQMLVQTKQVELFMAPNLVADDRLIVVVDGKCRIAAIGWPHQMHCILIERMAGDRILVHDQGNCILSEGLWSMVMTIAKVNTTDQWGSNPGFSVTSMMHKVHNASMMMDRDPAMGAKMAEDAAAKMAQATR
jgi:hypothetical protein